VTVQELIAQVKEVAAQQKSVSQEDKDFRLVVGLGKTILKDFVNFTLADYYNDPRVCLESQLKWKLFLNREVQDDTVFNSAVGVDYAVALEPSLFGTKWIISESCDPTYGDHVIREHADLDKLTLPDFYKSGLMPKIHELYSKISEMVNGEIPVLFPGWARGPWSIACMLRGFTPLYYDLMDNPEFVHRLMNFIVESRIKWETDRCKFLGINPQDMNYRWNYCVYRDPTSSDQYNDEVDGNLFSVSTYREFILPYEKRLAAFYGGIDYYHSCGNLTPFLEDLVELPGLRMLHVSAATNLEKAHQLRKPETILQVSIHPINDVLRATETEMEAKIKEILTKSGGKNVEIWADALYEGSYGTLSQAKLWLETSRRVYSEFKANKGS